MPLMTQTLLINIYLFLFMSGLLSALRTLILFSWTRIYFSRPHQFFSSVIHFPWPFILEMRDRSGGAGGNEKQEWGCGGKWETGVGARGEMRNRSEVRGVAPAAQCPIPSTNCHFFSGVVPCGWFVVVVVEKWNTVTLYSYFRKNFRTNSHRKAKILFF